MAHAPLLLIHLGFVLSDSLMPLPADAILQDAREKKRVWSLDHLKAMRTDRNRYVALYKRKKQLMEKKKTVPCDIFMHTPITRCQR